jgi:hypothetical protein
MREHKLVQLIGRMLKTAFGYANLSPVIGCFLLFLLEAMSPVLHVEGLRTLLGVVVVGRRHSVAPFVVFVAFHRCCVYML